MANKFKRFVAITRDGEEFFFKKYTARAVPTTSAEKILAALNESRHMLKDGEKWFLYDMDGSQFGTTAETSCFIIRHGYLYDGFYD